MTAQAYQGELFTVLGNPWSFEKETRDLRVALLDHLGELYGIQPIPADVGVCPECGKALHVVMHWNCPLAYCRCGYFLSLED